MSFVVHNVTSQRLSLRLLPCDPPAEGTPNWRSRRLAKQHVQNVNIDPHRQVDLETFGLCESELLRQTEVLRCLRLGYLRRIHNGAYLPNQFGQVEPIFVEMQSAEEPKAEEPKAEEPKAEEPDRRPFIRKPRR